MSRTADKLFSFLDEQERFYVAMGLIRPDFIHLPGWAQEMAYNEYCKAIEETKVQFKDGGELDDSDLSRAIWHSTTVDRYLGEAVAGVKLSQGLVQHRDSLKSAKALDELFVHQFRYFSNNIGAHSVQYCLDIDCSMPFLTATFDANGNTIALHIYDYPVDIETGEVAQAKESKAQLKPTPKQLSYAKRLASQAGVDLPYFNTRRAIAAFIHKYAPPDPRPPMADRIDQAQAKATQQQQAAAEPKANTIDK